MRPKRVGLSLTIALLTGWFAADCASVTPTRPRTSDFERDFGCAPVRGTEQGLLLQVRLPEGLVLSHRVAVYRDGQRLAELSIADVGYGTEVVTIGDESVAPGERYHYACGLFEDGTLLARSDVHILAREIPEPPSGPNLSPREHGTLVSWRLPEDTWAQVYRRDILTGDDPTPISPVLRQQDWLDRSTIPGHVYAYSICAILYEDSVPWRSEPGPERYVEVPAPD